MYDEIVETVCHKLQVKFKNDLKESDGSWKAELLSSLSEWADSFAFAPSKSVATLLHESPYDPTLVEKRLNMAGAFNSWWTASIAIAFEMIRTGVLGRIETRECLDTGITPETWSQQMWFGEESPPVFSFLNEKFSERRWGEFKYVKKDRISIRSGSQISLEFLGPTYVGAPSDLMQLVLGGHDCIKARRVVSTENDIPCSHGIVRAISDKIVSIVDPGTTGILETLDFVELPF